MAMRSAALFFVLLLAACSAPLTAPPASPTATLAPTVTPIPTFTPVPPTPTTSIPILEVPIPELGTVAYDFIAHVCEAQWTNNGQTLLCPGYLQQITPGYIGVIERPQVEGELRVQATALLTVPAQGGGYYGIFGKYPPLTVQAGDRFRAVLACWHNYPCEAEYALEYIDANGAYQPFASWNHRYGGGPVFVYLDLSPLANQTVNFVLVVRDNGNPSNDFALWIIPYIYRP